MKLSNNLKGYLVLFVIIFFLVSCKKTSYNYSSSINIKKTKEVVNEDSNIEKQFTLGLSIFDTSRQFFAIMQNGVLSKADDLDVNVITHDQKAETSEMITGAINLINQGIDALLISPVNPDAMIIITQSAKDAGIPVIVIDGGTGGAEVDAFIISDSVGGGVFAAQYALKLIADHNITSRNVAIFKVEETAPYARRRGDAFMSVMLESGYDIVANVTTNSDVDLAYNTMTEILETYKDDLAVVFAENDLTAIPVAQAIADAGKKGEIMVIGFDAVPAALEAIEQGFMQGTITQQPYDMGALGVELAIAILKGDTILYDDPFKKEIFNEVFLVDETGTVNKTLIN